VNNKLIDHYFTHLIVTLFVIGTAIYIFPAGSIQPGHYLAPVIVLIGASFIRWHNLNSGDKWLLAFGLYALVVNAYYYFSSHNTAFLASILYWGYNIALFITLSHILMTSKKIRSILPYVFLLCIVTILILWSMGYIRIDLFDTRFIAQFNDPNQMGYWLLCAFIGLFLLAHKGFLSNRFVQLAWLIIIALLISASGSRSTMFGLIPLMIGFIWLRFFKEKLLLPKPVLLFIVAAFIATVVVILGSKVNEHSVAPSYEVALAKETPLNRLLATNWRVEAKRRGYLRPIKYPQYLLLGAGHGDETRFNSRHEIHSSFLSVFFYYGIVGLVLFIGFLYQIFRRLSLPEALMLSAPFVYGFFTYGLRTPIFWVLMAIVVASRPLVMNSYEKNQKVNLNTP